MVAAVLAITVFDRALQAMKEFHGKVENIHLNPVNAGFVHQPEDWPWSSIHDYSCGVKQVPSIPAGLSIDHLVCPPKSEREFENGGKPLLRPTATNLPSS